MRLKAERKVNKQTKMGLEIDTMSLPIELEECNVKEDFLIKDYKVNIKVDPDRQRLLYQQIVHKTDWHEFRVFRDIQTKGFKFPRKFVIIKQAPPDTWDRKHEVRLTQCGFTSPNLFTNCVNLLNLFELVCKGEFERGQSGSAKG